MPVGYADGYRRALEQRGVALLGGSAFPSPGRVTMDMTMLDVTDTDAALGDVVTLLGRDGDDVDHRRASSRALGELSPYELLTGLRAAAAARATATPTSGGRGMRRRAIILVLDGVGIGAAPDAAAYGDVGSDTLGNLARAVGGLDAARTSQRAGLGQHRAARGRARRRRRRRARGA